MDTASPLWGLDTTQRARDYLDGGRVIRLQNFVGNEFRDSSSPAQCIESFDPRTGAVLARVPRSDAADVDAAIDAAARAFPAWSQTTVRERSRALLRVVKILEDNKELFAVWESIDQGKTLSRARVEVDRAIENFRYFATFILHEEGAVRYAASGPPPSSSVLTYEHRSPVGIFGLITPWNMPLYLLTWKIAPCLAFGCVAVAKPSEVTSVTAMLLGEAFRRAEIPAGVVNIVFGDGPGAGSALVRSPRVRGISFTGGTGTGVQIRRDTAADVGKHLSLELGGKNPVVVFADANVERAVALAARAAFENSGQICLCGSRAYVQRAVFDAFITGLAAAARERYKLGETLGPVASRAHYAKVRSYLELARQQSAVFHAGHVPAAAPPGGYWIEPVVLSGVDDDSAVARDEIFGPVVTVSPFDSEDDAVRLANDNANGLAAVVLTNDVSRMRRVAERIDAGLVWVNCWLVRELGTAFGGMKASGLGREGGLHSRDVFTTLRTVHLPSTWLC